MMNKQKIVSLTLMGAISVGSCMPAMAVNTAPAPVAQSSAQTSEEGNIAALKAKYEEAKKAYREAADACNEALDRAHKEADEKCEIKRAALNAAEIKCEEAKKTWEKMEAECEEAEKNYDNGLYPRCEQEEKALEAAERRCEQARKKRDEMKYDRYWGDPEGRVVEAKAAKAAHERAVKEFKEAQNVLDTAKGSAREEAERKCEQAKAECMKKYEVLEGVLIKEERKLERAYEEAEKEVEVRKQVFEEAKRGEWKRCIIACKSAKEIYEKAKITLETEEEKFRIERSKAHDKAELKCSKEKLAEDAAWIAREEAQEALDEALAVEAARAAQAAEIE